MELYHPSARRFSNDIREWVNLYFYEPLVCILIERLSWFTRKLARQRTPLPFAFNAVLFAMLNGSLYLVVAVLLVRNPPLSDFDKVVLWGLVIFTPIILMIVTFSQILHRQLTSTTLPCIFDTVINTHEVADLQQWL